jgi:hypothetical protein
MESARFWDYVIHQPFLKEIIALKYIGGIKDFLCPYYPLALRVDQLMALHYSPVAA